VLVAFVLAAAVFGTQARPAEGNAHLEIVVTDASNGKPVPFARVFVGGPGGSAIAYTDESGLLSIDDLRPGAYSLGTYAPGFRSKTSAFEATGGITTTVAVALAPAGTKVIATVKATSRPSLDIARVSSSDGRVLPSGSLYSAISTLPDVSAGAGGISVDGLSANATQPTIDGVAIPQGGNAQLFATLGLDLFNAVSVRPVGSVGGPGIDLTSSDPTIAFSADGSAQLATFGSSSTTLQARGTSGFVGFVVRHVDRSSFGPLEGLHFFDESGLSYDHGNGANGSGDLVKVRLPIDVSQHILLEASELSGSSDASCNRRSGGVPCGYGRGSGEKAAFGQLVFRYGLAAGKTSFDVAVGNAAARSVSDFNKRFVGGTASPYFSSSSTHGLTLDARVGGPLGRHDLDAELFTSNTRLDADVPGFVSVPPTRYSSLTLTDAFSSGPISSTIRAQRARGAESHTSLAIDSTLHLSRADDLHARIPIGTESATPIQSIPATGSLDDPSSVQYDCLHGHAFAAIPGEDPHDPLDSGASIAYRRSSDRWSIRLTASSDTIHGAQVPTTVGAAVYPGSVSPEQLALLQSFYASPFACGAAVPLTSAGVFLSGDRNATLVQHRVSAAAAFALSRSLVLAPYVALSRSLENSTGAWIALAYAPSFRAGLLADYHFNRGSDEFLALATVMGANNANGLPPYTQLDVGYAHTLTYGRLILGASNVTGAYSATFASTAFARELPNGVLPIAQPLRPASFHVSYEFRAGVKATPPNTDALNAIAASLDPSTDTFSMSFSRLPDQRPAAPFAPDTSLPSCTPELVSHAKDILDAMQRKEGGGAAADPPGVEIDAHPVAGGTGFSLRFASAASSRSYFGCVAQHFADVDEARSRGLFVPARLPSDSDDIGFFDSRVGAYTLIESASASHAPTGPSVDLLPIPSTPPSQPFALRPTCATKTRGFAQHVLAGLQRRLGRGGDPSEPSQYFKITQHRGAKALWSSLSFFEATTLTTIESCGNVVGASSGELSSAGVGGTAGTLNFTPSLGLYVVLP